MNEWEWQLLEDKTVLEDIEVAGVRLRRGDQVRLRPRPGGDVLDLALAGRTAIIESLEQDYEGNLHVCVVIDDDPGRDIGLMRQPGHRFFFPPAEIDEILSLRILAMTEDEKREMRDSDERARQILERTETLPGEQLIKLHGAVRRFHRTGGEAP